MTRYPSTAADADWPSFKTPLQLNAEGHLVVSNDPPHQVYWHEYGNPKGEPVFFIHGGPGGGTSPTDARYFDPARYRIIMMDQRGCGKSMPSAKDEPEKALAGNDTDNLIGDIKSVRDHLGIKSKMHLFGGSWGSTLALAYTVVHPEDVQSLTLRGIFLNRRQDLDYLYQGNAAHYPSQTAEPGAYQFNPAEWGNKFLKVVPADKRDQLERMLATAWKNYVEVIPPEERGDMVKAYAKIFASRPATLKGEARKAAEEKLNKAASAWSMWEGVASFVAPEIEKIRERFDQPDFAMAFGQIENYYFMNGGFLGGRGDANRDNNFILENLDRIAGLGIPITIVQGRYDRVCPRDQADALYAALRNKGADVNYVLTDAGHSATEYETMKALAKSMQEPNLPRMKPWELEQNAVAPKARPSR